MSVTINFLWRPVFKQKQIIILSIGLFVTLEYGEEIYQKNTHQ